MIGFQKYIVVDIDKKCPEKKKPEKSKKKLEKFPIESLSNLIDIKFMGSATTKRRVKWEPIRLLDT